MDPAETHTIFHVKCLSLLSAFTYNLARLRILFKCLNVKFRINLFSCFRVSGYVQMDRRSCF
jgi:hypothetical protein